MIGDIQKDAEARMMKTVESTREELNRIRTGRASTAIINHIMVDYYGTQTPIDQVSTIAVTDARTLSVQPWDKNMLAAIEKAILRSDLGLNPVTAGTSMHIPLPSMTETRRIELVKSVKRVGENSKVALRNIRRDAIQTVRELLKAKELSEDQEKQSEKMLQTLTGQFVSLIDNIVSEKELEVLTI